MLPGSLQAAPALVDGMIVGQRGMRDTSPVQVGSPAGIGTEDVLFVERGERVRKRALQIDYHGVGLTEIRLHLLKQIADAAAFDYGARTTVQQHVARKKDGERVVPDVSRRGRARHTQSRKEANSQSRKRRFHSPMAFYR